MQPTCYQSGTGCFSRAMADPAPPAAPAGRETLAGNMRQSRGRKSLLMRVLQLVYSRNFAGTEQSVLTLSRALQAQGHEVFVGTKSGGTLAERYGRERLKVIPLPLNAFFIGRRLAEYVRAARIDVIHAHLTEAARIACRVNRRTGVPMVTHLRILRNDPAYRVAARQGPLIANSEHTAEFYRGTGGIPPERIHVIPNATLAVHDPWAEFPVSEVAASVRQELRLPPTARLIAFPGRIAPEKGHETMLQALPAVLTRHPETHVIVVGNLGQKRSYRQRLLALRAQLGLERNVHFVGFRGDVLRFTRAAEAQLVLSKREPFGLVLIEAMAMGTALIGTDAGAIPAILEQGALGTLVPPEAPAAVTAALQLLLDEPARFRAKAEAARLRVRELYSPTTLATRVAQVYLEAIRERGAELPVASKAPPAAVLSSANG
jgi:glycosyltransferase involved in cell wall biosynthesis